MRSDPRTLRKAARDIRERHGYSITITGYDIPAGLDDAAYDIAKLSVDNAEMAATIILLRAELGKSYMGRHIAGEGCCQIQAGHAAVAIGDDPTD